MGPIHWTLLIIGSIITAPVIIAPFYGSNIIRPIILGPFIGP